MEKTKTGICIRLVFLSTLIILVTLYFSFRKPAVIQNNADMIQQTIAVSIKERDRLINILESDKFSEPSVGILSSYLKKIRRDGVAQHADMKQHLNSLAENTTVLMTLVDLYEPQAKTTEFKAEAKKVRAYAIAWTDRWNSVMDLFMSGGGYPLTEVPFPDQFAHALQLEIAAAH